MPKSEDSVINHKLKLKQYDPSVLIQLVKERPCIWDKTITSYNVKTEKSNAWREIFLVFEERYDDLDKRDQLFLEETIVEKWKNIRDAYVRCLRKNSRQQSKRRYIYADKLSFLIRSIQHRGDGKSSSNFINFVDCDDKSNVLADSRDRIDEDALANGEDEDGDDDQQEGDSDNEASCSSFGNSRKRLKTDGSQYVEQVVDEDAEVNMTVPVVDEDAAFFQSIVTMVRPFSEDEKLNFRISVMALIQDIKQNRAN